MTSFIYCVLALFVGGALKGVVGLGLPLVGVPLLTFPLGLEGAVSILVLPIIVSNIAQSFAAGLFPSVARRFFPLLAVLFCVTAISTRGFNLLPERGLFGVVGAALVVFPTVAYLRPTIRVSREQEPWLGTLVGAVAGVLAGVSSMPGPPLMIYLACLRLPKNEFVVAVSLMFLVAQVGLGLGLIGLSKTGPLELSLSAAACIPVLAGMWLGSKARLRVSDRVFSVLVFATYLLTGVSFLVRAL
ncbi:MAG TPA: sulfite exporter TauE/SafE family protein [Stellaceae bacterium]|nr:sulfite exporter TauE/SafE family protein [Stellaceae bacterium]